MSAREIEQEKILQEVLAEPKKPISTQPLIITNIALVLIIIMLLAWYIPSYAFPPQAKPGNVASLEEVLPSNINMPFRPQTMNMNDYVYSEQEIKILANRIVVDACSSPDSKCYAEALYYFVRDNIHYVNDPIDEYYELPQETLLGASADCDGHAILLASLLQSVGIETKFTYQPRHVVVEAWVPKRSLFSTKNTREWLLLDATCKKCRPGYQ